MKSVYVIMREAEGDCGCETITEVAHIAAGPRRAELWIKQYGPEWIKRFDDGLMSDGWWLIYQSEIGDPNFTAVTRESDSDWFPKGKTFRSFGKYLEAKDDD